jgi:hypothetical protein
MSSNSEDPFPRLFCQLLPFLFSLIDDALILGLSRLGCEVPWLKALSPIVIGCTVLYLVVQVCKHAVPSLITAWQEFRQQPEEAL